MVQNSGKPWKPDEDDHLRELAALGVRPSEIALKLDRTKSAIMTRAYALRISFGRVIKPVPKIEPRRDYVFDHYLFTSRRGTPPAPWFWEIRRKSNPDQRSVSVGGFKSAKAAEEAGRTVLSQIRDEISEKRRQNPINKAQERLSKIARKSLEAAIARVSKKPLTPERRSELARLAAQARAQALTAERRKEIGRMGGAAAKERARKRRSARNESR
jgi:hypothetical protein